MASDDEREALAQRYCPVHGDLLAGARSPRCSEAPKGHEFLHRQGQITEAMVEAARKAIHRSIVLNHFAAIAAADTWDQNDYEAMLNEFAVVALEAALNAKEDS